MHVTALLCGVDCYSVAKVCYMLHLLGCQEEVMVVGTGWVGVGGRGFVMGVSFTARLKDTK